MKFNLIVIFIVSTIPLSIFDPDLSTPTIMTTLDDVLNSSNKLKKAEQWKEPKTKKNLSMKK